MFLQDIELKKIRKLLQETRIELEHYGERSSSPELLNMLKVQLDYQTSLLMYYHRSEERITHLESLVNASRILNSTLDLEEVLRLFMDIAIENMRADRSTLYLVDKAKQELWSVIHQGPEMIEIRLPIGRGIAGMVAQTGEVINIDDPYNDSRFYPEIDRKTGYVTRNILCMPMRNKVGEIIGVMQILNKNEGNFTSEDEFYLESLSMQASIAVENATLHKEALERRRLESELRVAFQIQQNFLPNRDPVVPGFSISGLNIPCLEVGGDYFDFIELDHTMGIAVGDVSGKGIPAALLMANLQAALTVLAPLNTETNDLVSRINLLLKESSTPNKFITFFYGLLDYDSRAFRYTNAGHNPPLLYRHGSDPTFLATGDLIMGAFSDAEYHEHSVRLEQEDILVLYTDGITESTNSHREQFGEDRLAAILEMYRHQSAPLIRTAIIEHLSAFTGGNAYSDDVTLIVIKVEKNP